MNLHTKDWFTEICTGSGSGVALSMKVKQIYHEETTKYQKILIFESETFGKCLSLDNAIQCTELDEFTYQEMIAFLALNSHPNPARVLIIGGGDGGVARECLKHPLVKELVQCEIDIRVVELAKQYFPQMAQSYANPKLKLIIEDGYEFVSQLEDSSFDVIITDSSDPEGPAECLFSEKYYEILQRKLTSQGIMCCQAESFWFDLKFIKSLMEINRKIFAQVAYASCLTCTYPSGQIGFLVCCKSPEGNLRQPKMTNCLLDELAKLNLKYYSREAHLAAFVLPKFVELQLYPTTSGDSNNNNNSISIGNRNDDENIIISNNK